MAPAFTSRYPALLSTDVANQLSAGVGLDTGKKRRGKPNEDFVFAARGTIATVQEPFGLYVVADGLGGHVNGQEASCLATETMVDYVLPRVRAGATSITLVATQLGMLLDGIAVERVRRAPHWSPPVASSDVGHG